MSPSLLRIPATAPTQQAPAQTAATEPFLVDATEAARLLAISPRTLWTLTKAGKIRSRKVGRRVLYSRAALEEFANS